MEYLFFWWEIILTLIKKFFFLFFSFIFLFSILIIKKKARFVTLQKQNKSYHWYSSSIVPSRIEILNEDPILPLQDFNSLLPKDYYHNPESINKIKRDYITISARILAETIPRFKTIFNSVIEEHIPLQEFAEEMAQKSSLFPLPTIYEDEKSKQGMAKILDQEKVLFFKK